MNTQTPLQSCCPTPTQTSQSKALTRLTGFIAGWTRAQIKAIRARPRVRVVPLGSPEALIDRPGERRVVFNNRIMIIEQRRAQQPPTVERSD